LAALAAGAMFAIPATAQDKKPIRIGFGMAETGPLGPNGKSALLSMEIWAEETNAKGGLLGRPVQLVHYDDQTNPSAVPGIYTNTTVALSVLCGLCGLRPDVRVARWTMR
jgi:branched-chain amino acid transport system substrate-binding protein